MGSPEPSKPGEVDFRDEVRKKFPDACREHDTPAETAQQDDEALQQQRAEVRARLGEYQRAIGWRYQQVTLESFAITTDRQREVMAALRQYAADMKNEVQHGAGIVLYGPSGTGKDHLLSSMGRIAIVRHGLTVRWANGDALFRECRDLIGRAGAEGTIIAKYAGPKILILSDPLPPSGCLTDYQAATLYGIIDRRYRAARPTWVSLNVASGQEADERLGGAIADRLRDGAVAQFCDWPSHRKARQ